MTTRDDETAKFGDATVEELKEKYADVDCITVDDDGVLHPDTASLSLSGYRTED